MAEISRRVGRDPSWLSRVVNQERGIKAEDLERLEDVLDVSFRGGGRALRERHPDYVVELVWVPVVDQQASASLRGGVVVDRQPIPKEIPAQRRQHLIGLRVSENSLAPRVLCGDTVIVDTMARAESGNPVVATVDGHLHAKWYKVKPSGRHVLEGDGPEIEIEPWQIEGVIVARGWSDLDPHWAERDG